MGEIKFRAWDKKIKDWIVTEKFTIDGNGKIFIEGYKFSQEDIKLMQYTGWNDIEGTEIYEDDIVSYTDNGVKKKETIIWQQSFCAFNIPIGAVDMKVIGKDLLK